jgi:hypothetical protein
MRIGIGIGLEYTKFAGQYIGILDSFPNAAVAYSLRKLRSAYAGSAVRIRRSGDNAEFDFGFDANGNFNTSSAVAFCVAGGGSQNGFIVTWYDQSGNATNASQSVAANQVQCIASGSWSNTFGTNTRASLNFDGLKFYTIGAPTALFTFTGSGSVFIPNQVRSLTASRYGAFIGQGDTTPTRNSLGLAYQDFPGTSLIYNADMFAFRSFKDSNALSINTNYLTSFKWVNWSTANSNGNSVIRVNGATRSLTLGATSALSLGANRVLLGASNETTQTANSTIYAYMPEIIIYASDQSANFTGIENNINSYYGIY